MGKLTKETNLIGDEDGELCWILRGSLFADEFVVGW